MAHVPSSGIEPGQRRLNGPQTVVYSTNLRCGHQMRIVRRTILVENPARLYGF
jgi:hypothetical protein